MLGFRAADPRMLHLRAWGLAPRTLSPRSAHVIEDRRCGIPGGGAGVVVAAGDADALVQRLPHRVLQVDAAPPGLGQEAGAKPVRAEQCWVEPGGLEPRLDDPGHADGAQPGL